MADHVIVVTVDDPDSYTIECPGKPACSGWIECDGDHEGYDPEEEASPAYDEWDDVEIHGVLHDYKWGHGWTVPHPGCVVADAWNVEPPGGLWDRETDAYKPGRWLVDDDWDDTDVQLILVGPEPTTTAEEPS